MTKIRAEMPSKPQQNHLGIESNASSALDVGTMPGLALPMDDAADRLGGMVMRAVSFFGPGWIGTRANFSDVAGAVADEAGEVPVGFGSGCKSGEAVTSASNAGGRRNGIRGTGLAGDGGGDRRGRRAGVISGLWGSALRTLSFGGSAITNQVRPEKSLKNFLLSL
jgi:hypothetical protein